MKLYADLPVRRLRQVVADVGLVAWVWVWVLAGRGVHDAALALGAPGRTLQKAGNGFRDTMTNAGNNVDDLPVLEDRVAGPFRTAAGAGERISEAGRDLVSSVERLATFLGWTTALVPIVIVGGLWLLVRGRFVRRASAAQRFVDGAPDLDLFALRAMANQPMRALARVCDDPAGAWRRGDGSVIHALALLELKESGLRPPSTARA